MMSKQFDSKRLRNLTTHRLHTKLDHIYEDLEWISGETGLMTHMLPNMLENALFFPYTILFFLL